MQFHGEEIPHFPNHTTEQTGFCWQMIHDKRSGVKIIQWDPKTLNIFDYGKETPLFSGCGNLWLCQLTTEKARARGISGIQKSDRFLSLQKMQLRDCKASPVCSHTPTLVEQAGLPNPSGGHRQVHSTTQLSSWNTTGQTWPMSSLGDNRNLDPKHARLLAGWHPFEAELPTGELHWQLHFHLNQRQQLLLWNILFSFFFFPMLQWRAKK